MDDTKKYMIEGMDVFLRIFTRYPNDKEFTVEDMIGISNVIWLVITGKDRSESTDIEKYNEVLKNMVNDPDPFMRELMTDFGYDLDRRKNKINNMLEGIDAFLRNFNKYSNDRKFMVKDMIGISNVIYFIITGKNRSESTDIEKYNEVLKNMVNDPNPLMRELLANYGYGLDQLVNDPCESVRVAVAKQKYGLEWLINDPSEIVRATVAEIGYGLDQLVDDPDAGVREKVAELGYGLERLVDDPDKFVRKTVAKQKYGFERLINDPSEIVRAAVAELGYGLEQLINDPDAGVRKKVAGQRYGLDQLINDPDAGVRRMVAMTGYRLDILICDPERHVRYIAESELEERERRRQKLFQELSEK